VTDVWGGLGNMAQALAGGDLARRAGDKETAAIEGEEAKRSQFAQAIAGQLGVTDPAMIEPKPPLKASPGEMFFDPNTMEPLGGVPAARPEAPTSVQEFEYAKENGFPGTYQEFITANKAAGASNVEVNTGPNGVVYPTPPAGYDYGRNPDGSVKLETDEATGSMVPRLIPLPGGEPATDAAAAGNVADTKAANELQKADTVMNVIGRVRSAVENQTWYNPITGAGGEVASNLPASGAFDARELTKTIESNIAFDRLQQMREESKTGGALGSITEKELDMLRTTLQSLSLAQSQGQFLENLGNVERIYQGIMAKAAAYPNAAQFGFDAGGGGASAAPAAPKAPTPDDPLGIL
jgi:hypothetical protein